MPMGLKLGMGLTSSPYALPDGTEPLTYSDFENGDYFINGAEMALGDVWVEDSSNYGNFDPETDIVDGVGLSVSMANGAKQIYPVSSALASFLSDGFTVIVEARVSTPAANCSGSLYIHTVEVPAYSEEWLARVTQSEFGEGPITSGRVGDFNDQEIGPEVPGALVKFAATFADDRLAVSVNGGAPVVYANPGTNAFNSLTMSIKAESASEDTATVTVTKSGYYPVRPDADLPTLSS